MRLWRITRKPFLTQVLAGLGAKKYGGRWNSKGVAVVYTSESLELAVLEALVHVDIDLLPEDLYQETRRRQESTAAGFETKMRADCNFGARGGHAA